jgi:hypothetical protein
MRVLFLPIEKKFIRKWEPAAQKNISLVLVDIYMRGVSEVVVSVEDAAFSKPENHNQTSAMSLRGGVDGGRL